MYTSKTVGMDDKINDFFQCINLPKVSDEDRIKCDMDTSCMEVEEVIGTLASGKACGADGLSPEIYKMFKGILSPLITRMFKHSLSIKMLPQSLQLATINMILKESKDPEYPESYRPISIQNTDCKILAKLHATRINYIIPKIVGHDQTGFVQNRQSYSNIRRVLGILQYVKILKLNTLVVSLDTR